MATLEYLLGISANVIQVAGFVFTVAAGMLFWQKRRQLDQRLQRLARSVSKRPIALAIGLGGSNEGSVRQFLKDQGVEMEVIPCSREGMVPRSEFRALLHELNEIKQKLDATGVSEVHLFYKGPVTFSVAVGALLGNWVPTKLYAFEGGTYVLHMLLDKDTVVAA